MQKIIIEYQTSIGKWKGVKNFAEINKDYKLINLCDKLIKKLIFTGCLYDNLQHKIKVEICNYVDLFYFINNSSNYPCPTCKKYFKKWIYGCSKCPLHEKNYKCCKEWFEIKKYLNDK
jgi:predicted RNA-binding Zn-ribbon protein involved in translation (DUF1610 family)